MEELLSSWWGVLVTVSGGIAVIVGLCKSVIWLKDWMRSNAKARIDQSNMEARIMSAVDELDRTMRERDEAHAKSLEALMNRMDSIDQKLGDVQEQSSALTYDKLMGAYVKHGIKGEPISVSSLTSYQRIYQAYAKNGRNHIPEDFMKRINSCPVEK